MTTRVRISKQQVIKALKESDGLQSIAADKLGVDRKTIYNYKKRWPELEEVQQTAREQMKDVAENKLHEAIRAGQLAAIFFFLKCTAKERGYIERAQLEHSGPDGKPIQHDVVSISADPIELTDEVLSQMSIEARRELLKAIQSQQKTLPAPITQVIEHQKEYENDDGTTDIG